MYYSNIIVFWENDDIRKWNKLIENYEQFLYRMMEMMKDAIVVVVDLMKNLVNSSQVRDKTEI